ncbi:hypothetical protein COA01_29490 [Bacillus cereus]|uniref:hypothetical protein n=1 Tax=Bacillus cereus TaxID=1396 RepID=UPI000BFC92F9|nr:hypothetical protein [Bacillus cereus]PGP14500.1 hypothetical protein COA01_29490 [Bacillus cereus]
MSIIEVANDIIIKSHQHIQKTYKELDIKFRMEIEPGIISIDIAGMKVQFKKWDVTKYLDFHIYSLAESHKEHATQLTYEILKEAMPFVYSYMEAIQQHEKLDGYVIARRPDESINKELQEVILETDHSSFTDEEREYAFHVFNTSMTYPALTYLYAAKLLCRHEEYIKKAVRTVKNIQEVLPNFPLFYSIGSPISLMNKYDWEFFYYGEEVTFYFIRKEHAIDIECENLKRTYKYDLPLEKDQITNFLKMIEEENRLKNLTKPETFFFSKFAIDNIGINNRDELFEDLIGIIGDWEQVELIFQDINVKLKSNESSFKKQTLFDDSSIPRLTKSVIEDETDFRYNIVCFDLQYKSYHFKFIRHLDFNSFHAKEYPKIKRLDSKLFNSKNYLFLGQVFVTNINEESQEAREYIQKFFNKASAMKKQLK